MTTVKIETIDLAAFTRKTRRACLRVCAKVTRKYARKEAPRRTGKLRQSLRYGMKRDNSYVTAKARYAHLLQRGVQPHKIFTKNANGLLKLPFDGGIVRKGPFDHPGIVGQDFLDAGLARARGEITVAIDNIIENSAEMNADG